MLRAIAWRGIKACGALQRVKLHPEVSILWQKLPEGATLVRSRCILGKNDFTQMGRDDRRDPHKAFLSITRLALLESARIYFSTAIAD